MPEAKETAIRPFGPFHLQIDRSSTRLLLLLLVVLGSVLRILYIGRNSLWSDEIVSLQIASLGWRQFWEILGAREANMGLYYLLLRPWTHFGSSEAALRALSAVAGTLTVPVAYKLAEGLFGTRTALITAFLFAINPCDIFFSQQARSYSLQILLVTLSMWLFSTCIQKDPSLRSFWFLYVLASTLAVYAHFFSALTLLAQWIAAAFLPGAKKNLKRIVPASIAISALSLPLVAFTLQHNVGQLDWVQPLDAAEVFKLIGFFCAGTSRVLGLVLSVFSVALIILVIKSRTSAKYAEAVSPGLLFAFFCLALPISITVIVSIWKPVFVHRYLVGSLPAFLLILAYGFGLLKRTAFPFALAIFAALSLLSVYFSRPVEDWRSAVAYILSHARPADTVVIYRPYHERSFVYYIDRARQSGSSVELQFADPSADFDNSLFEQTHPRVWLVLSGIDEPARGIQKRLHRGYLPSERRIFSGVQVELFTRPADGSSLVLQ